LAIPPVIPPARKKVGTQGASDAPRHRKRPSRPTDSRPAAAPKHVKVATPPVSPGEMPTGDLSGKARPKKDKRKKWEQPVGAAGAPAKALARKKRSVVEGKDLYDGKRGGKKGRRKDNRNKQRGKVQKTQITTPKAIKRRVKVDDTIELAELAKRMGIKANEMIVKLMGMGVMATVNQTIDYDTAALVAVEFDYEVERASFEEDLLMDLHVEENPDDLIGRSPVVTIMGHVDHGKTSLLDVIRKSKITTGEAGGITQHIGAYSVETPKGLITFLDTPGHAAFTAMRSRGAQVTDLVVLVVAADDGVMPQTIEAINHSKAAKVPVIVAVNKMDKPDADPDRVMRELSEHGLVSEDWGGDVIFAKVSAKANTGIDQLLEMILLQAEVLELKANPTRPAIGHVVEARLDAGRGPVATVLVEQGTLKVGAPLVCGLHSGKIRIMIGDSGQTVIEAGPSTPVEIVGLSGVPEAGDEFMALSSEKDAKQISGHRMQKERAKELAKKSRANLEKLFANMGSDEIKELRLIIKADVHGSLEALNDSVMKLAQEEVDIKIVHSGTGAINESDISLAAVSDAIIIGFNVRPTPKVRGLAKEENIDMRFYDIIYNVINDIKTALTGLMPSTFHENVLGRAEVRDVFVIPNKGTVAGSFVLDGKVTRGDKIRLLRDGVVKCKSTVASLRRFKDDVKEVAQGYECGIAIEKYNDIKMGDIFECYEVEERKATLEQIKE
ncbi:MAG: translation initiation factor IF-2, partial [Desulfobacterium sp.]